MLGVSRLLAGSVTEADALRYERQSKALPFHLLHYSEDKKPVVVWTSTRRCNLHCAHCYTDSFDVEYPDELTTEEALAMVDDLTSFGSPVLLISGGEPLRRPDLEVVAGHAVESGMRVVISTNGTLITPEKAEGLAKTLGVSKEQVIGEQVADKQAIKEVISVEEIAASVAVLCSDAARSITAAAIPVDGGWTAV